MSLPNFNFKLNVDRWQKWQLELSGADHSMFEPNFLITIEAEDLADAKHILGIVVDHTNFDLQENTVTAPYEIPGGCGSEN